MKRKSIHVAFAVLLGFIWSCKAIPSNRIICINNIGTANDKGIWLTHEHILVDFIGADSINPADWDHDTVIEKVRPNLEALKAHNVSYFVDCTPAYLGRDVRLLEKIANEFNLKVVTNTGFYGAGKNKFVPQFAKESSAQQLATIWTNEFKNGIDGTKIRPGFIKIGVDSQNPLDPIDEKLVHAACLTHLSTGLTIASHTGQAKGLWPQILLLKKYGISPSAFIWVHAQFEFDNDEYLKAAEAGCWISLDNLAYETEQHIEKLVFAKTHNILDHILISHDSGWYDPQKEVQQLNPYTNIFEVVIPELLKRGFTEEDINQLLVENPIKAFSVERRTIGTN